MSDPCVDPETSLQYDQARYYDPTTAQFLTRDPANATTRSAYAYTNSNPLNFTDPSGLCLIDIACAAQQAVGNGLAGLANGATGGLSTTLLNDIGITPNTCSAVYQDASIAGFAGVLIVPGLGEERLAAEGGSGLLARLRGINWADETGSISFGGGGGDLTAEERAQIQGVVDRAGRPLEVVGSAARGERGAGSDIDYTAPNSSHPYFAPYVNDLPGLASHGLLHGGADPLEGPSIRFEPGG